MNEITDETVLLDLRVDRKLFHYINTLTALISKASLELEHSKNKIDTEFFQQLDNLHLIEFSAILSFSDLTSQPVPSVEIRFKDLKLLSSSASWIMLKQFESSSDFLETLEIDKLTNRSSAALSAADNFISDTQGMFETFNELFHDVPQVIGYLNSLKGQ